MSIKRSRFTTGIELKPTNLSTADLSRKGEFAHDSSDGKLKHRTVEDFEVQEDSANDKLILNNHIFVDGDTIVYQDVEYSVINSSQNDIQLSSDSISPISIATDDIVSITLKRTREVVEKDTQQTFDNKLIDGTDATGNNTVLIDAHDGTYDDELVTVNPSGLTPLKSLGTNIQEALDNVKIALDNQNEASEIAYDDTTTTTNPSTGGTLLSLGEDVQEALDKIKIALDDQNEADEITYAPDGTKIIDVTSEEVQAALDDLDTDAKLVRDLSGTVKGTSDLGDFDGDTITSNTTIKAGMQELETAHEAHVDQITGAHAASAISYNNTESELEASNVQAAVDEIEERLDTAELGLYTHINATVDAHDASAISYDNTESELTANNMQAAIDEVEDRLDTAESGLTTHTTATSAHGTTSAIVGVSDTQILDNKTINNGVLTGSTQNSGTIKTNIYNDTASTGTDVEIINYTSGIIRLADPGLVNVNALANPEEGKEVTLINATGSTIAISNDSASTAANGILTGIKGQLLVTDQSSILLKYNSVDSRWMVIGATENSEFDVDVLLINTFERSTIDDYIITGSVSLTNSALEVINGSQSLKIDHNSASSVQSLIPVANKFRGKTLTLEFDLNSNATSGNILVNIDDHGNSVAITDNYIIEPYNGTGSEKREVNFVVPETCAVLSIQIDGLLEPSAITIIDGVKVAIYEESGSGGTGIPLLAKGSLVTSDGSVNGEISVGTNGQLLVADSTEPSGLKWTDSSNIVLTGSSTVYSGNTLPSGYLIADGATFDRVAETNLYAVIGEKYNQREIYDAKITQAIPNKRQGDYGGCASNGAGTVVAHNGYKVTELFGPTSSWIITIYDFDGNLLTGVDIKSNLEGLSNGPYPPCLSLDDSGNKLGVGFAITGAFSNQGRVRVYDYSAPAGWIIDNPNPTSIDEHFGRDCQISGDGSKIIIGTNKNICYVYAYDGASWIEEASITKAGSVNFGRGVSINYDGSVIAVGDSGANSLAGDVHIYRWDGVSWNLDESLAGVINPAAGDLVGYYHTVKLSYDGNSLAIGCGRTTGTGKAWILDHNGSNFELNTPLVGSIQSSADLYGTSISISGNGDVVSVGAPLSDINGSNRGAMFIFHRNMGGFIETSALVGNGHLVGGTEPEQFGKGNALNYSGSVVLAGAPNHNANSSGTPSAGAAYGRFYAFGGDARVPTLITENGSKYIIKK